MSHHTPAIGGPGTILPRAIESALSWSLAIAALSVSGYHFFVGTLLGPYQRQIQSLLTNEPREECATSTRSTASDGSSSSNSSSSSDATTATPLLTLPCWVPLMTYSRSELDRATPLERYQQFLQVLQSIDRGKGKEAGVSVDVCSSSNSNNSSSKELPTFNDNELVGLIRTNESLCRLASLAMRPSDMHTNTKNTNGSTSTTSTDTACIVVSQTPLGQQLIRIWPRLLELPGPGRMQDYQFAVSNASTLP
jgi:hypothetical protein